MKRHFHPIRPALLAALAVLSAAHSARAETSPIALPPGAGETVVIADLPLLEPVREVPADTKAPPAFEPPLLSRADVKSDRRVSAPYPRAGVGDQMVSVLTLGLGGGETRYNKAVGLLRDGRSGEAEKLFLDLAESERDSPLRADSLYWLGEIADSRGDAADALRRYEDAATASPPGRLRDYADYAAGWTACGMEQWTAARERFALVAERTPPNALRAKARFWTGAALAHEAGWKDAAASLRAYLDAGRLDSRYHAEARYMLAAALYHTGDHDASAAAFDAVQRLPERDDLKPRAMLGSALARLRGRVFNLALELTVKFLKRYPLTPDADLAMAAQVAAAAGLGRANQMEETFNSLLARFPDSPRLDAAYYEVAWRWFDKDEPEKARALLMEMVQKYPLSPVLDDAYLLLGECYFRQKAYAQAALLFKESAKRTKDEAEADDRRARAAAAQFFGGDSDAPLKTWSELADKPSAAGRPSLKLWVGEAYLRQGRWKEALDAFSAVPEADPGYPRALYQSAYSRFRLKDFAAAAPLFGRFASDFGYREESGWAALGQGESATNLRSFADARAAYRQTETLLKDAEGRQRAFLYSGVAFWLEGRYDDALRLFENVESLGPTSPYAQAAVEWWARARMDQGDVSGAVVAYKSFLSRFPGHERTPFILLALGDAHLSMKEFDRAAEYFAWVREKYADSPAALEARRGELLATLGKGDRDGFETGAREFIEENPRSGAASDLALALADDLAARKESGDALEVLRGVAERTPGAPAAAAARLRIGRIEMEAGRQEAAREALDRLVADYPTSPLLPQALLVKAETLHRQGRYADEVAVLDRILASYGSAPEAKEAGLAVGRALTAAGRTEEARTRLAELAQRYPDLAPAASYEIGRAWQLDAKYADALRAYRDVGKAEGVTPEAAGRARLAAAEMLEALEQPAEAESEYRKIAELYGKSPEFALPALWRTGVLLEGRGLDKEAARVYEKIVANPDAGDWRPKAEARLRALAR